MKKYGAGEVLPDEDEEQTKTAATNWTERDRQALAAENEAADTEQP